MTIIPWMLAAALLLQEASEPFKSVFDQPMSELSDREADSPLDRLSLNQMLRFSTLPAARLNEFKCAGIVNWAGSKQWPKLALGDEQRTQLVDRVIDALANDVEIDRQIAVDLVARYSEEPPYREKQGELKEYRAEMERDCAALVEQARAGLIQLHPLAASSVVNTTLATCYARYTVAADAKRGEEAVGLRATAEKAKTLALAGKTGPDLDKAQAALANLLAEERKVVRTEDKADMMQLVMCLPAMDAAKMEQEK